MTSMDHIKLELASLDPKELDFIILLAYHTMNNYLEKAFNGPFDWEKWESELRRTIFYQNKKNSSSNSNFERVFLIKLVCKPESNPIGFVWISLNSENIFWIDSFVLVETYRGKGYGRQTFAQLVSKAKKMNLSSIDLGVQEENDKAIGFYNNLGFYEVIDISLAYYKTKRMRFDLLPNKDEKF